MQTQTALDIEALATENFFDFDAFSAFVAYHGIEDEE